MTAIATAPIAARNEVKVYDAATLHAAAKFLTAEAKKSEISKGEHKIDNTLTIDIKGIVNKFADESYTPTVSIPIKATLALLLNRMGFQRDKAAALIVEVMTEALKADEKADEALAATLKEIEQAEQRVADMTAALPKKTRKGKTTDKTTATLR